jgi:hypothetical protein
MHTELTSFRHGSPTGWTKHGYLHKESFEKTYSLSDFFRTTSNELMIKLKKGFVKQNLAILLL